ncbi:MAG: DUF4384 domain-containing protein [Bacteroidetes bacterium]|nr:DUF4384 domain-containing protein [Bacteroidota bacterium]
MSSWGVMLLFLIPGILPAQVPDWVERMGESPSHPSSTYLTGFGVSHLKPGKTKDEALGEAVNAARRHAAEKIRVSILGTVESRTEERDTSLQQYFSAVTESRTILELEGLDNITYLDAGADLLYALAFARKDQLAERYSRLAGVVRARLNAHVQNGRMAATRNDAGTALAAYVQALPLFRQLEELEGILVVLREGGALPAGGAGRESRDAELAAEVETELSNLLKRPVRTLDDAAALLIHILSGQIGEGRATLSIEPPSLEDTRSGSPFSRHLYEALLASAATVPEWKILEVDTPRVMRGGVEAGDHIMVRGTYRDVSGGVHVRLLARDTDGGAIVGSAAVTISDAIVGAAGFSTLPANYTDVAPDLRKFEEHIAPQGGLHIELWTNKGGENPVFVKGERMRVFVRSNMPCVVRLIYHLADGQRTVLMDGHRISAGEAGEAVRVPGEFECDAPYGAEVLQAFASTTSLPRLDVEHRDGYAFVTGSLDDILRTSRGRPRGGTGSFIAEARVVVTTMPE